MVGRRTLGTDNCWDTGGTGGTVGDAEAYKAMIHALKEQSKSVGGNGAVENAQNKGLPMKQMVGGDATSTRRGLGGIVLSPIEQEDGHVDDDGCWEGIMGHHLEAMVDDLAGADSIFLGDEGGPQAGPCEAGARVPASSGTQALLEAAFSNMGAARDALSRVCDDVSLRDSAPAFVPGEMWTGTQRSNFED